MKAKSSGVELRALFKATYDSMIVGKNNKSNGK